MIFSKAITGEQTVFERGSPQSVLADFYHAFNTRNLEAMADNWLHTEEVSMSNPLGGVRRGWDDISAVYKRIFEVRAEVYVEFYDYSIHESEAFFCAVGRERGYFKNAEEKLDLAIRTSRIYQKQEGCWRQLHHHGSIEQAELLKAYQTRVVKK
jgi:ketosteroid isomerase-like protein